MPLPEMLRKRMSVREKWDQYRKRQLHMFLYVPACSLIPVPPPPLVLFLPTRPKPFILPLNLHLDIEWLGCPIFFFPFLFTSQPLNLAQLSSTHLHHSSSLKAVVKLVAVEAVNVCALPLSVAHSYTHVQCVKNICIICFLLLVICLYAYI